MPRIRPGCSGEIPCGPVCGGLPCGALQQERRDLLADLVQAMVPDPHSRSCQACGVTDTIDELYASSSSSVDPPDRYSDGCDDDCLACWLGVGPNDVPCLGLTSLRAPPKG